MSRPAGPRRPGADTRLPASASTWTFLTNHAHVLVCIAEDPGARGRDIAARVGITERAVQAILADLVTDGYVTRTRVGRRNRYTLHVDQPLRHPLERDRTVGQLLAGVGRPGAERHAGSTHPA